MKPKAKGRSRRDDIIKDLLDEFGRMPSALFPNNASGGQRHRKIRPRILGVVFILLAVGGVCWLSQDYLWNMLSAARSAPSHAALIDPLSETLPDPGFLNSTMVLLQSEGYAVDYYGPSRANVQLFRDLPLKGYDLVIIRAHTSPAIFTGESYSNNKYVLEQVTDQVEEGTASATGFRFAITDRFVRLAMHGTFKNSIIINMGCNGLGSGSSMAEAFLDKGAGTYVGWDGGVSVTHTDTSTLALLRGLAGGRTLKDVVKVLDPDPSYHSVLSYTDKTSLAQERFSQRLAIMGGLALLFVMLLPVIGVVYGLRRLSKN